MALSPDRAREVGKLGGRPKGSVTEATKKKQEAQLQLRQMVEKEIKPITDALILKAKDGDVPAIKELFDRAWGKATQPTQNTHDVSDDFRQLLRELSR